jgi:hypothetical protein
VATIPADGIVATQELATSLAIAAQALEPFGIPLQPVMALPLDASWVRSAWQAAEARSLAMRASLERIRALPDETPAILVLEALQDAVATVFGGGFQVVPVLLPGTRGDGFVEAMTHPVFPSPPASELRRFVRDLGTVRQQITRLSEALLVGRALGHPRDLTVVQLSELDSGGNPAPGTTRWLAGGLPPGGPWPASPTAHLMVDLIGNVAANAGLAGIVIDGWVEDLPAQVTPKADPQDPRPGRTRTGLAVRCNSASARPPQALLCAVSPNDKRWTTDSVRAVVESTLDLARVRMVTLERLAGEALVLPALYTRSSSLQGEPYLVFNKLAQIATASVQMSFVKESAT